MSRCSDCGASTVWDDDAASDICTACGTLVDASQSVLTTHIDRASYNTPSATLKSFRIGQNWDLPGQGKEARDRKNDFSMAEYIKSLASSLNAAALSPRAMALFVQAKALAHFRWGRKSKLVAGACLAIALREYHRPDALHDIAFLLQEPFSTLVRTLFSVTSLLNLSLTPSDPSFHIPDLTIFLSSLIAKNADPHVQSRLSPSLLIQLRQLSLQSTAKTATSLSNLLTRLGPDHPINQLPSPPTACALFLLALESESRAPLSNLSDIAHCFGTRCHVSRAVVMERYKTVQDEVSTWIERVPWLAKYERTQGKRVNRAKVGKRTIVARGLRDVVQFQEQIWRGQLKPNVVLDASDDDDDDDLSDSETCTLSTRTGTSQAPSESLRSPPPKRQKTGHRPLAEATRFLLNPLSSAIPSTQTLRPPPGSLPCPSQKNVNHVTPCNFLKPQPPARRPPPSLALASYILTAPSFSLSKPNAQPPSRLQLLAAERGGGDAITDDELFAAGELEGLLRGDEEAADLYSRYIDLGLWDEIESTGSESDDARGEKPNKKGTKRKRTKTSGEADMEEGQVQIQQRKGRINLEALARFLQDPALLGPEEDEKDLDGAMYLGLERFSDDKEDEEYCFDYAPTGRTTAVGDEKNDGVVIVDEWRPASPVGSFHSSVQAYEEEFD